MCKFPVRKTSLLVVLALVDGFVFVIVCLLCAMDFPSDLSGKKIIKLIDHIDHAYYCWASYIYIYNFFWGRKAFKLPLFYIVLYLM